MKQVTAIFIFRSLPTYILIWNKVENFLNRGYQIQDHDEVSAWVNDHISW